MRPVLYVLAFSFVYTTILFAQFERINSDAETLYKIGKTNLKESENKINTYFDDAGMDSFIVDIMESYHIAGFAASVVKDDAVVWHRNYGYANIEEGRLVSDSTLFLICSTSKTFVTTAIMQLWEDGLFDLDDNINQYLPEKLQVINPNFPDDIITFKMLLTHTSSLKDNWNVLSLHEYTGDSVTLDSFLVGYFIPGGEWYDAGLNFYTFAPGEKLMYCNMGFALLGYLVEQISGDTFEDYCQTNIFRPLAMENTSWFLSKLDTSLVAKQYKWTGIDYKPYKYSVIPHYPAGTLRTSTLQLSNFLISYMNNGLFADTRILDSLTINSMLQYYAWDTYWNSWQGLGFYEENRFGGELLWGHGGNSYGAKTGMLYDPVKKYGYVDFSNTGLWDPSYDGEDIIQNELARFAKSWGHIYAIKTKLDRPYINPNADSLSVTTKFVNRNNHDFTANLIYTSFDSTLIDSLPLYDDGDHNDLQANDGIWGGIIEPIKTENSFFVLISTTNLSTSEKFRTENAAVFTSTGPLVFDSYRITSTNDQEVNAGDYLGFKFTIRNMGSTATAMTVTSYMVPLDTCASTVASAKSTYGNLLAGTAVEGTGLTQYIRFNQNCGGQSARFALNIYSDNYFFWTDTFSVDIMTGIEEETGKIVTAYNLYQNYPNPFNPITMIEYQLPQVSQVDLSIYDLLGQKVVTLVSEKQAAGSYKVEWNAAGFASGIYYYRIEAGEFQTVRKMILIR